MAVLAEEWKMVAEMVTWEGVTATFRLIVHMGMNDRVEK